MGSLQDDLLLQENASLRAAVEKNKAEFAEKKDKVQHPKGWEPGFNITGKSGEIVSRPTEKQEIPDWDTVLDIWGLDPEKFEVVEPVQFRAWDANVGGGELKTLYYCKATIQSRSAFGYGETFDELLDGIKNFKPSKKRQSGASSFVVALSDWQIGKGENGGTKATIDRIQNMIEDVEERIEELRAIGRDLGILYVVGLGDIVENCDGHYANQAYTVDLNLRDQMKIARRLIRDAVIRWSKLFEHVVVSAVGGNHGENRRDGKAYTGDGDNLDVSVFESVAEILGMNDEAFGHVSFVLPDDEMAIVLDISGETVAFAHGHKARRGSTVQAKQKEWWKDMAFQNSAVGDASILVSAHYHHFSVVDHGPRVHLQCPAMDGGSKWFSDGGGGVSATGTLTFVIDEELGLRDIAVI